MYCLTLFYRYGSQVKLRHEDDTKLQGWAKEALDAGLLTAYRIVHVEAGKCIDYWKEDEGDQPIYQI
jgi:hypothetical protein